MVTTLKVGKYTFKDLGTSVENTKMITMEYEFRNIKVKDGDVIEIPHDIRDFKVVNVVEMNDSNYHRPLPTNSTYVQWFQLTLEEISERDKRRRTQYLIPEGKIESCESKPWWKFW